MSLPESLEQAAAALPADADGIRPANGDPDRLLAELDAAAAARVLGWLLGNAPDAGGELATAWLESPDGVAVVLGIDEAALPKAGRKVLRRALHAARSRGIDVDGSRPPAGSKVARLPDLEEDLSAAYVSPLDPRGSRLVYLVESPPGGGARVFEALLDDERGLVDFQLYKAGRRQVRDFIRDVTGRKGGFAAVESEPTAVRALIARAASRHPADRPLPKPFPEWRSRLLREVEGASTPGELAREALGNDASDEALAALADVARARGIGPWPPGPAPMEALVGDMRARAEEAGDAAADALEGWTAEALSALYVGECADVNAWRFEESAYVFWRRGEEDAARACLATAASLRDGRGAESPVMGALCEVIAAALTLDLKQSLGLVADDDAADAPAATEG